MFQSSHYGEDSTPRYTNRYMRSGTHLLDELVMLRQTIYYILILIISYFWALLEFWGKFKRTFG